MTKICTEAVNYIIRWTNEYNQDKDFAEQISMTCKRVQKLLYFSEIEYMKRNNGQSMFTDEFYAWPSGPVIPSVYHKFMPTQCYRGLKPIDTDSYLTKKTITAIDYVLNETKNMDTLDFVDLTKIYGGPWQHAYNADDPEHEQIISKVIMRKFYKTRRIF